VIITTQEEAVQALLDQQELDGGIPTLPASGATVVTDAGWAFFNVNGYLGTVTNEGEVVAEAEFVEAD
jgi:hypothetical protein